MRFDLLTAIARRVRLWLVVAADRRHLDVAAGLPGNNQWRLPTSSGDILRYLVGGAKAAKNPALARRSEYVVTVSLTFGASREATI
jgi:hypothetical protein